MGSLGCLDYRAKIVKPIKPGFITFKSSQKTINTIWSFSNSFCKFWSDKLCGIICWQFMTIFVLQESKIFLNIISENKNIRMFSSNCKKFFSIKVPNFIIVVLYTLKSTFIRSTEYALMVSAAMMTKSLPLIPISESMFKIFLNYSKI